MNVARSGVISRRVNRTGASAILKVAAVKPLRQYQGAARNGVTSHDSGPFGAAYRLAAI